MGVSRPEIAATNPIAAFWAACVITRPLAASVADWLGRSALGGLGLGDGAVAIVLSGLIVAFVGYLMVTMTTERSLSEPR